MKASRVGQVWEVGNRVYLVVSIQEETEQRVVYNGLILDSESDNQGTIGNLVEHGEGQWERMSMSSVRLL